MLLSKKEFTKKLKEIQTLYKDQDAFCTCLETITNSRLNDAFIHEKSINIIIDLLEKMFDDNDEDISNFLFELDAINSDTLTPTYAGSKDGEVVYSNVDDLYDYLVIKIKLKSLIIKI